MIIRKYNESYITKSEKSYFVIIHDLDDYFGVSSVTSVCCFPSEIMAADYVIKYTNYFYKTEFESFFEEDQRLFANIDENEDYENCLSYLRENEKKVIIKEGLSYKGPKHLIEI